MYEAVLIEQCEKVNGALENVGMKSINIDKVIENIDAQIKTANSVFKIAIVGTFKTGKSTIINSLLDLKGESRLSSEYEPDTAKCIRLAYREEGYPEAEVDFGGVYPTEQLSWQEAKRYTSQVALNEESSEYRKKAESIDEVRYYLDVPFLKMCNILDLPGTGTGSYLEHTNTTDNKILQSDCFFWVVSTNSEPDVETAKNLEKIRHKIIPIINVWQKESENICGAFTPEQIIELIEDGFSAYIGNASDAIVYYAGEIDEAQRKDREVLPEWGKETLLERIALINANVSDSDNASRITRNLKNAIDDCSIILSELKENPQLIELNKKEKAKSDDAVKQLEQLSSCKRVAYSEVGDEASKTADEIVDILSNASASFIQTKMSNVDFSALMKERYKRKIADEFEKCCIRAESGWIEAMSKTYCDNISSILEGRYIGYAVEINNMNTTGMTLEASDLDVGDFTNTITELMNGEVSSKLITVIISTIGQIILAIIPGGTVVDSLYTVGSVFSSASKLTNSDKLQMRAQVVINHARTIIKQQKYSIYNKLKTKGEELANYYHKAIYDEYNNKKNFANDEYLKIKNVFDCIGNFEQNVCEQKKHINEIY